ncbi:hypothetical protein MTR67_022794, partial [Solanum verrucosum]
SHGLYRLYGTLFHDLIGRAMIIIPTKKKRVCCFVRGLRLQLQIEIESMVSAGLSILDIADHTSTMEQLHHEYHMGLGLSTYSGDTLGLRRVAMTVGSGPVKRSSRSSGRISGRQEYDTWAGLIVLGMLDFDVIMGMDWLSPYRSILDCFAKTITLPMPSVRSVVLLALVVTHRLELSLLLGLKD